MFRVLVRSLLFGLAATIAAMLVKIEYCVGGPGYGFPAAIIHPSHQEWWLIALQRPAAVEGLAFDAVSVAINVTAFSLIACAILYARARRLTRRPPLTTRH